MKKLIIADIVLLFLSKLSKVPATLFSMLGKVPFVGFIFGFISKLFLTLGKLLTIPFYILTAVLIIMILLKLFKNFKKKKINNREVNGSLAQEVDSVAKAHNVGSLAKNSVKQMDFFKK